MMIIVFGMAAVYLFDLLFYPVNHISLSSLLAFDRSAILRGQIWRIVTFVFIPPNSSPFFIFLSLYFYWLIGSSLENQWGAFRFNVFYLCGVIGTMLFGFITGYATNYYLNLSLFFAFALIFPDFQLMLFFILPVKVKYLALLDAIGFFLDAADRRMASKNCAAGSNRQYPALFLEGL